MHLLYLKAAVQNPAVTYSMPYGFIEKSANGEEEPCHAWCDLRDGNGKGLALLNTGKYSFCAVGNDLRMRMFVETKTTGFLTSQVPK